MGSCSVSYPGSENGWRLDVQRLTHVGGLPFFEHTGLIRLVEPRGSYIRLSSTASFSPGPSRLERNAQLR